MTRIALGVEYCGRDYAGWQAQQSGVDTIAARLEAALSVIAGHPVSTVCAGRTDRGVHATGQVVHFDTSVARPMQAWVLGSNRYLPEDIAVLWAKPVPETFHARFSARWRAYRYVLLCRMAKPALWAGRATVVHRSLHVDAMRQAGRLLLGSQDFQSFRSAQCQASHAVRTLMDFAIEENPPWCVIRLVANAFVHHMVRNIVGSLLEVGYGTHSPEWFETLLTVKDRRLAGITAPADGLYLTAVGYPAHFALPTPTSLCVPE